MDEHLTAIGLGILAFTATLALLRVADALERVADALEESAVPRESSR